MSSLFMRDVYVLRWDKEHKKYHPDEKGQFLSFGITGEYSDMASLQYSSVIVLMVDGTMKNVPIEMVQFINLEEIK